MRTLAKNGQNVFRTLEINERLATICRVFIEENKTEQKAEYP